MPAVTKHKFDYVAHVNKKDGTTVELSGSKLADSLSSMYQYLLQRAVELGGWLITQKIESAEAGSMGATPNLPVVRTSEGVPPSTFGAEGVFGEYKSKYSGASRLTFKEKQK